MSRTLSRRLDAVEEKARAKSGHAHRMHSVMRELGEMEEDVSRKIAAKANPDYHHTHSIVVIRNF